jgi:hypothetical protein
MAVGLRSGIDPIRSQPRWQTLLTRSDGVFYRPDGGGLCRKPVEYRVENLPAVPNMTDYSNRRRKRDTRGCLCPGVMP